MTLTHLQHVEAENFNIMREVVAEAKRKWPGTFVIADASCRYRRQSGSR
jgi:hypothetical protein